MDKVILWQLQRTSKVISCMGYEVPFWQFFRKSWDGHALLVQPSKMHLVLGNDEYLERLEDKIRKCLFFYVRGTTPSLASQLAMTQG